MAGGVRGLPVGSLRDLLRVLFRHLGKMLVVFAAVVGIGFAAGRLIPPTFRSEARVLVRVGRANVTLDPTVATGPTVGISQNRQIATQSELVILKSPVLYGELVDAVGVDRVAPGKSRDEAIAALEGATRAFVVPNTNIIALHCEAGDAESARDLLTTWIDSYQRKHLEAHRTAGSYDFFKAQTRRFVERIAGTEAELQKLRADTGVIDPGSQRQALLEREKDLRREVQLACLAVATEEARIVALENQDPAGSVVDSVRQKLVDAQLAELDLATKYQPSSPRVTGARDKVRGTLEILAEVGGQRRSAALAVARGELAVQVARRDAVVAQLRGVRDELREFVTKEQRIEQLQRDLRLDRATHERYVSSLEQARIDSALEEARISNISVTQPPTLPVEARAPRPSLFLAIAIVVGALGALVVAFVAEVVDPSLRTPDRVRHLLGTAAFGSVPNDRRLGVRLLVGDQGAELGSRTQQALDSIVAGLLGAGHRVVAVAGARSGDGVTAVAGALASRMAAAQPVVLAVDADFSARGLTRALDLEERHGLADVMVGARGDATTLTTALAVLPAGREVPSTLGQSQLELVREEIAKCRSQWGFVFVDVGDLASNKSRATLAAMCDSTVLVVDAERTRWQVVAAALRELETAKARVAGLLLNRRRFHIPQFLYRLT